MEELKAIATALRSVEKAASAQADALRAQGNTYTGGDEGCVVLAVLLCVGPCVCVPDYGR